MMQILTLIGVFTFPKFTLGCVCCHFNQPVVGVIIILVSVFKIRQLKKLVNSLYKKIK
jgi:hypothetical protein